MSNNKCMKEVNEKYSFSDQRSCSLSAVSIKRERERYRKNPDGDCLLKLKTRDHQVSCKTTLSLEVLWAPTCESGIPDQGWID